MALIKKLAISPVASHAVEMGKFFSYFSPLMYAILSVTLHLHSYI